MLSNITYWLDETTDRFPDKIGYVDGNGKLTFSETKIKALNLANMIVQMGLFKKPIAIYMEKSTDALVSFFAVAYSGNFYSPIDVTMPESRIIKIFECLQPELIITKKDLLEIKKYIPDGKFICMDDVDMVEHTYECVYEQREKTCDTDLLYVLFTSGSTGIPKGVSISHKSVIDFIDCIVELFNFNETDAFGNQAPFYFDNSILDIYTTMRTGAVMYIIPQKLFAWPIPLLEYLDNNGINNIFWVPSALIIISKLKALKSYDMSGKLKRIMFCGEVMPNKQLNIWRRYLPDAVYVNMYGPTEITDVCTYYVVEREFSDDEPLPIGKAMKNTDIMVLNSENKLVVGDEVGELCVRGTSLSLGYYNNPQKTSEVFVQNPLNTSYPELIYRTGDIVRYNERGEIIYLSRKDFQIKHLGHRIELGEIETAVSSLDEVSMNCCLYDDKHSKIVLFIEGTLELSYVNEKISRFVPEYMLPNRLICLDKMPINVNGKIDRVKLKEMI